MKESSDSQFLKTTSGIQWGPDPFDKSRFIMTFLTILGVTEILCSFKLVTKTKTDEVIPESSRLEFLENFSTKYLGLSDPQDKNSGPSNNGGIADLPLLRTLLVISQKS